MSRLEHNIKRSFINKSREYLWPSIVLLKSYQDIKSVVPSIITVGAGIQSCLGLTLFFQVTDFDKITQIISRAKEHGEYLMDTIIDTDIHAIVLKCPVDINAFLKGEYSKIYTDNQLRVVKEDKRRILQRDQSARDAFIQKVIDVAGDLRSDTIEHLTKGEYDFPPVYQQEIIYSTI